MRFRTIMAMLLGIALCIPSFARAEETPSKGKEEVDLLLVLAADVSRSINYERFRLQRNGYAAALVDKRVLQAISSGPLRRIAVAYVEWSGILQQKVIVDWSIIDGLDSAQRFAEHLREMPRPPAGGTAIGTAIEFCVKLLYDAPYAAERKTIDISGDGDSNEGRDPSDARDDAVRDRVVINGLPILSPQWFLQGVDDHTNPPGGLEAYYRNFVIGGPGAFVQVARDHKSFGEAIVKKMIAEIALR